jgi:hypothetical protein
MKKTLRGLAFSAMLALTLLATTSNALAKETSAGRETAWTAWADLGPVQGPEGVTWETVLQPVGVSWEE